MRGGEPAAELSDPWKIFQACQDIVRSPQEHLVVFYLNVRNREINRDTISIGTASASLIHPREVFRPAIVQNASHIVLAHNHPSGDPTPSQADKEVTVQLVRAGQLLSIQLLDHLICCPDKFVSLQSAFPHLFCYATDSEKPP